MLIKSSTHLMQRCQPLKCHLHSHGLATTFLPLAMTTRAHAQTGSGVLIAVRRTHALDPHAELLAEVSSDVVHVRLGDRRITGEFLLRNLPIGHKLLAGVAPHRKVQR